MLKIISSLKEIFYRSISIIRLILYKVIGETSVITVIALRVLADIIGLLMGITVVLGAGIVMIPFFILGNRLKEIPT